MKKICIGLLLILSFSLFSQKNIKVELTESYELGNIILALTEYGKTDPWDVQKIPPYYDEILQYFDPVKDHPLLKKVNYSREKWKNFLGFRTDMYAFSFDKNGKLKRDYPFNSFGPQEVDDHLELINDFVKKSDYRQFYRQHQSVYKQIIKNYKDYYFINKSFLFLDDLAPKSKENVGSNYIIAISPLVGGQNCHREIDSLTTVDFPNIDKDLILGNMKSHIESRISANHSIFTEMDHGYVNPLSSRHSKLISANFNPEKWAKNSGYKGINIFNEYMTWAVYDLFIHEYFPKQKVDSISNVFSKQNSTRGFIAQNIFSKKLLSLYQKSSAKKLDDLYEPMLKWCKSVENKITQPLLLNADSKNFISLLNETVTLNFSEPMKKSDEIEVTVYEFQDGKQTKNSMLISVKNPVWSKDGRSVSFKLSTTYNEYALGFYHWKNLKGLYSQNDILLYANSYILIKK
ncbi:DUF4932 domain-containing protein [Chryseobacterium sp. MYb264]|uniref:DUF4932 domain-containing protein n=1 Tax=Chryseobacterium sp. MYb264 TaxID=2745153 RepID=UPI002E114A66|nr:DUF4932 domain-containing protein [Chryseobacterium sp. MYb264]